MLKAFLIFFICGIASLANAKNSHVATTWNELRTGQLCLAVSRSDIAESGLSCMLTSVVPTSRWVELSSDLLERTVFDLGAKRQIKKNQCLAQQLTVLKTNPEKRARWVSYLALTWARKRKADLIKSACYQSTRAKAQIEKIPGIRNTQEGRDFISSKELPKSLKGICDNKKMMDLLKSSDQLFRFALPVASSTDMFDVMESSREIIFNSATNKPITDEELLKTDLSTGDFLELDTSPTFVKNLDAIFDSIVKDRTSIADSIQKASTTGIPGLPFDQDLKDYIFDDGTIKDVLMEADLDFDTTAGSCLLSRYEKRLGGVAADFAVTSATGAGIFYKLFEAYGVITELGAIKTLAESTKLGAAAAAMKDMPHDLMNACTPTGAQKAMKMSASPAMLEDGVTKGMPPTIGYNFWQIPFTDEEAPACKGLDQPNSVANPATDSNCVRDILFNLLPMRVVIPIQVILKSVGH